MIALAIPMVHLNGTSRQELEEQLAAASVALNNALSALIRATPHGRDYYPQGADILKLAFDQHKERMLKIQSVISELETIYSQLGT